MNNGTGLNCYDKNSGAEESDAGVIRPGSLPEMMWIDIVSLGRGCVEGCKSCGVYASKECVFPDPITVEQLKENLSQEIISIKTGTRFRVADLLNRCVSTSPDMEPLGKGIFCEAAEMIYDMTEGEKKMVCISHGVKSHWPRDEFEGWRVDEGQLAKLNRVVELMLADKIPLFVLSLDTARAGGLYGKNAGIYYKELQEIKDSSEYQEKVVELISRKGVKQQISEGMLTEADRLNKETAEQWRERCKKIEDSLFRGVMKKIGEGISLNETEIFIFQYLEKSNQLKDAVIEANAQSYAVTLFALVPAIRAGKRVTISLQGDGDPDGLVYEGLAYRCLQRTFELLEKEYKVDRFILETLSTSLQDPRRYVLAGRAKKLLLDPKNECDIIPDTEFIRDELGKYPWRIKTGRVLPDGELQVQNRRSGRGYNDYVCPAGIPGDGSVPNPWKKVDLSVVGEEFTDDLAAPSDFVKRIIHYADPRIIQLPNNYSESDDGGADLSSVYPFSMLGANELKGLSGFFIEYLK
ncbi:MAG: hypothetical protein PHP74_03740, partial [Candidatus Gracilibacteria bacterium]|nr:hypothetical protein [Candidatus Gracilibacteria bacterium]